MVLHHDPWLAAAVPLQEPKRHFAQAQPEGKYESLKEAECE